MNEEKIRKSNHENRQRMKQAKVQEYQILNEYVKKGKIVFVGSSLMELFPIHELIQDFGLPHVIYNRGVSGFTTQELLEVLPTCVYNLEPSQVFINIGTNDMNTAEFDVRQLMKNYEKILQLILEHCPEVKITMMAYYPGNLEVGKKGPMGRILEVRTNQRIASVNQEVEKLAMKLGLRFINVNAGITDKDGNLKAEYTLEGMHMNAKGYKAVLDELIQYL